MRLARGDRRRHAEWRPPRPAPSRRGGGETGGASTSCGSGCGGGAGPGAVVRFAAAARGPPPPPGTRSVGARPCAEASPSPSGSRVRPPQRGPPPRRIGARKPPGAREALARRVMGRWMRTVRATRAHGTADGKKVRTTRGGGWAPRWRGTWWGRKPADRPGPPGTRLPPPHHSEGRGGGDRGSETTCGRRQRGMKGERRQMAV